MTTLKITQLKSEIGGKQNQRDSLRSLGLKRIGHSVEKEATPVVLGMINAVRHLVAVEEVKK
jgi:large subunit ribosomal protein L30